MKKLSINRTSVKFLVLALVAVLAAVLVFAGLQSANAANDENYNNEGGETSAITDQALQATPEELAGMLQSSVESSSNDSSIVKLNARKTAEWTNDEKTEANVTIDITSDEKIGENPNFLFLGTMCNAHTLTKGKLVAAINGAAAVGNVDWYTFGNDNIGSYNHGHLNKGEYISEWDIGYLQYGNHQTLGSFYDVIGENMIDYGIEYDSIIMEFDRSRIADYYGYPSYNHASEYQDQVADLLVNYYDRQKVVWVVDQDGYVSERYVPTKYYIARQSMQTLSSYQYHALIGLLAPKYYNVSDLYYDWDNIPDDAGVADDRQTIYTYDAETIAEFLRNTLTKPKYILNLNDTLVSRSEAKLSPESVSIKIWDDYWQKYVDYEDAATVMNEQNINILTGFLSGETKLRITISFKDAGMFKVRPDELKLKDPNYGSVRLDLLSQLSGDKTMHQSTEKPLTWDDQTTYKVTTEVEGGTIDPSMTAAEGENVKVNYQPYDGFALSKIYVDGQELSASEMSEHMNNYTFSGIDDDHTIKVVYTNSPEKIIIKFVDSEDTSTWYSVQAIDPNTCAKDPGARTKVGKTFTGWYLSQKCEEGTEWKPEVPFASNSIVYAGWKTAQCTVHFKDGMDTTGQTEYIDLLQTVDYGSKAKEPTEAQQPTKEGYTFNGWYYIDDLGEYKTFDFETPIYSTTTLWALWKINSYTVTFVDSLNWETVYETQQVEYYKTCTRPTNDPTKTQYYFVGWYADWTCTTPFLFDYTPITKNTFVYAKWDEKPVYTVKFVDSLDTSKEVAERQTVVEDELAHAPLTTPEKYGYVFKDWYTSEECKNVFNFEKPITGDTTVYAGWNKADFTVTFVDSQDWLTVYDIQTVKYQEKCTDPGAPTKEGYNFTGWYTTEECKDKFSFDTPIENHTLVFAGWELKDVTVTFVDCMDVTKQVADPQTIKWNTTCVQPDDPTKASYYFNGWYTSALCQENFNFENPIKQDTIVYAGWREVPVYTVDFVDSMDTSTVYFEQKVAEGGQAKEPSTAPEKEGYTFKGWCADQECSTDYDFNKEIYENTTVYAKWEIKHFSVMYVDSENWLNIYKYEIVDYGNYTTAPDNPSKEEKTFEGWFSDYKCSEEFVFADPITDNTVIYAGWKDIPKYKVVFLDSLDFETVYDEQTVLQGEKSTQPQDPEKEGFVFTGWYSNQQCSEPFHFEYPIYENTYVYAGWTEAPRTEIYVKFVDSWDISTEVADTQQISVGGTASKPDDPIKKGRKFTGWYSDQGCTKTFEFSQTLTVNTIVYAGWVKTHTVKFLDSYDFTEFTQFATTVEDGGTVSNPGTPTKESYTFKVWFTDWSSKTAFDFSTKIYEDINIYADWTENPPSTVSVMFVDSEEVTTQLADIQTFAVGGKATRPADPEKEGKVFRGWFANQKCTQVFNFGTEITQNTIVYAGWTPVYKVTFLDSIDLTKYSSQDVVSGQTANVPEDPPAKAGKVFTGWYKDQFCREAFDFTTPIEQDTFVYAGWVAEPLATVNVLYVDSEDTSHRYGTNNLEIGKTATPPADPTKDWETFTGWYVDKNCTTKFDFDKPILQNTVIYAGWYPKVAVVYVDIKDYEQTNAASNDYEWLKKVDAVDVFDNSIPPENPQREGYLFTGWYFDEDCTIQFYPSETPILWDTVVYAGWVEAYKVNFVDSMNVETVYNTQTIAKEQTCTDPGAPAKEGYAFTKWYEDKECTTEFDFATQITEDRTVYAGWEKIIGPDPTPDVPEGDETTAVSSSTGTGNTGDANIYIIAVLCVVALGSGLVALKKTGKRG